MSEDKGQALVPFTRDGGDGKTVAMPSVADYQLALASLPCPKCIGTGQYDSGDPMAKVKGDYTCETCSGSGFLLQGVRERCPICKGLPKYQEEDPDCSTCQGRGWIPSGNPFKYAKAFKAWGRGIENPMVDRWEGRIGVAFFKGDLAYYEVTLEAIEALGVKEE